mgnify:CR=1 FL=1
MISKLSNMWDSSLNSVMKNSLNLFGSFFVAAAVNLVIIILISRNYDLSIAGLYFFAISFTKFFNFFINAGLSNYLISEVSKSNKQVSETINLVLFIRVFLSTFIVFVFLFVLPNLLDFEGSYFVCLIASIWVIVVQLSETFFSFFKGKERMDYIFISKIFSSAIILSFSGFFIFNEYPIFYVFVAYILGSIFDLCYGLLISRKWGYKFSIVSLDNLFVSVNQWYAFFIAMLMIPFLYYLHEVILQFLKGPAQVAIFGAAFRIIMIVENIPSIFAVSVFPVVSKNSCSGFRKCYYKFISYMRLQFILSLFLCLFMLVFSKHIILIFFGSDYISSVAILKWGTIAALFMYVDLLNDIFLFSVGKTIYVVASRFISIIVCISANLLLVPEYGYYGSLASLIFTFVSLFLFKVLLIIFMTKVRR